MADATRPCRAPAGLALVLADLGVATPEVLARCGLRDAALHEPRPWLTIAAYFDLWVAIEAVADDPTLGARMGAHYPAHVLEPAFLACLGSRDLGEALARLARYKCTLCPERLTVERRAGRLKIRYDW